MALKIPESFDGTGRPPFALQREFLEWLQKQTHRIVAAQLPPGSGKSFIVRSIQRGNGATVITPSNMLVNQYVSMYPTVNVLKGQQHYDCRSKGLSCGDARELGLCCKECPYVGARRQALDGVATFYNPISLYNLTQSAAYESPRVTVVDEAHSLLSMLMLVAGEKFSSRDFRLPKVDNAIDIVNWLRLQAAKIERLYDFRAVRPWPRECLKAVKHRERLKLVADLVESDTSNYVISYKEDAFRGIATQYLHIAPILPPRVLIDRVLGSGKVILMSGTLSRFDAALLAGAESFAHTSWPSPIEASQRQVLYRPRTYESLETLSKHIVALHAQFGGPTIVHVTYALGRALTAYMPEALTNTQATKDATIERFKRDGGIFLASGCAEGLDLPDGTCRLNIIPVLPRPNIGDPVVKKWLAKPGGSKRYDMETLRTFQQQVGRSTRHIDDWSVTVVCDPRLPDLIRKNDDDIAPSFLESINWRGGIPWD